MTPLRRAAEMLKECAADLRRAHAYTDGVWPTTFAADRRAKREHDEMLEVAAELEKMAEADDKHGPSTCGVA